MWDYPLFCRWIVQPKYVSGGPRSRPVYFAFSKAVNLSMR